MKGTFYEVFKRSERVNGGQLRSGQVRSVQVSSVQFKSGQVLFVSVSVSHQALNESADIFGQRLARDFVDRRDAVVDGHQSTLA